MDMKKKKEIRNITMPVEVRESPQGGSRHIEGYALVFNTRSQDLGGFTEVISPDALDGVLDRSDVMALLNHDMNRGVLARFRNGGGSLSLEVDDKGLRYSFDAPATALGDEVLEGVRRGDISGSSFAFTVEAEEWEEQGDGYLRTIKRFGQLFDISPVYNPAYLDTSVAVDSRGLDALKAKRAEEEKEEEKEENQDSEEDEAKEDERSSGDEDSDPDNDERNSDEAEEEPEENSEEKPDGEECSNRNNDNNNSNNHRSMKKKSFSLLRAIAAAYNRRTLDDVTLSLHESGSRALRESGITPVGQIVLPLGTPAEQRFEDNPNGILASQNPEADTYGGEAVPTELFDLLGPLRDRLIVTQLGARMLNLKGNVEIPIYSGANVFWESEIGDAQDGAGKFSVAKMSPKRITAFLDISKQWLIQTDASAEALIRQDLVNAVAEKLQSTMFGDGAGDDKTPAGLFNGVSEDGAAFTYGDAVGMEEALESANIYGDLKYVASPGAKAKLRQTNIDRGSGRFVMENNEILGLPVAASNGVVRNGLILGDWSQFYIANFGALDLTVDQVTRAGQAQVRLVVNAWFDYLAVRPEAFVKRILK